MHPLVAMAESSGEPSSAGVWDLETPTGYWRISGIALAAIAVIGLIVNAIGGNQAYVPDVEFMESILVFDWAHDVVHVVLAAIALGFGFTALRTHELSRPLAGAVGVVYVLLGIAGFVPAFVDFLNDLVQLHLEIGENVIHLLLGAWGVYVGFVAEDVA